ncbi:hypothetical protein CERSUDRAFT_125176 [Gelatoporia subvermispora B]|uniref:Peptidase A1 domain-containing protein n=1 Tax=Ceriporiopsis subvermispora (strain B) TaxID=914234 RepID=M2QQW5_CERS8|nr:hypothetical protein CERSUDRAFT_125176 [Gelatoporia subvermispora B]
MFSKTFTTLIFLVSCTGYASAAPAQPNVPTSSKSAASSAAPSAPAAHALPITRRLNITAPGTLAQSDRLRAQTFRQGLMPSHGGAPSSLPTFSQSTGITNSANLYYASVGVGNPPTQYTLIVDTGSSNTWVGANQNRPYNPTSTSQFTGDEVSVSYGSGAFAGTQGEEYLDTVTVASGLAIQQQSIGAAFISEGMNGADGILGLGPTDLTEGTLQSSGQSIPTVIDTAAEQGLISAKQVGIAFAPTTSTSQTNGEITFGGSDSSKFTGSLEFVPITAASPANEFVGIDQSITYGSSQIPIMSQTAGIVDTGTSLLMLPSDAFQSYVQATGATPDETTGLLTLPASQFSSLQSLFFTIGDTTYEFTADAQAWPVALNSEIGGNENQIYLIVGDTGSPSGAGLDFTNGLAWLERFYFVYDSGNNQVGFANTQATTQSVNVPNAS